MKPKTNSSILQLNNNPQNWESTKEWIMKFSSQYWMLRHHVYSLCSSSRSYYRKQKFWASIVASFNLVKIIRVEVIGSSWRDAMAKPSFTSLWEWVGTSSLSYISNPNSWICLFPLLLPLSNLFLFGVSFFKVVNPSKKFGSYFSRISISNVGIFSSEQSRY